jgi:hypothetical protein
MDEQKQKQKLAITEEFVAKLVEAFVGQNYEDITPEKQIEIEKEILPLFINFCINHIAVNYGEKEESRVKALLAYGDGSILTKFPETNSHLGEALDEFIKILEETKNK